MQYDIDRREFARRALTAVAAVGIAGTLSEPARGDERPAVAARRPKPADRDKPSAASVEDHLLAVIRRCYPDPRLSPDVLQQIRRDVAGDVERSRVLNSFVLQNSDEPAFVFAAYRGDAIR